MTSLVIAAVIVGVTLGDVGFYLGTGTTPGSALGKPMWSSLGLGVFGIAIALKERGAARWAFFGWALHQGTYSPHASWLRWLAALGHPKCDSTVLGDVIDCGGHSDFASRSANWDRSVRLGRVVHVANEMVGAPVPGRRSHQRLLEYRGQFESCAVRQ